VRPIRSLGASAILLACARPLSGQHAQEYTSLLTALEHVAPRSDSVAPVHDVLLRRDVIEFHLDSGRITLLTPVASRTVGALFTGKGSVSFSPPLPVERGQLQHALGDSSLTAALTSIVFFFTDSTLAELNHRLSFARDTVALRLLATPIADALDRFVDGRRHRTSASFMAALLNGEANGFFYASVKRPRGEDLMFEVNPDASEPIELLRNGRYPGQRLQTICQFPRAADVVDTLQEPTHPSALRLSAYHIDATFDNGLKLTARATAHLTATRDAQRWARFYLFDELKVDSIQEGDGTRDSFFRDDGSAEVWVRFGTALHTGDSVAVRFAYHGRLIDFGSMLPRFMPQDTGMFHIPLARDKWFYIKDTETWYPRYNFWQNAATDLTFHTPEHYQFASIGRLVDSQTVGGVRTTHWVAEQPTAQVSFNIGEFREFNITDARVPPVTVQVNLEAHRHLDAVLLQPRDPQVEVGADVANSLSFFSSVFGPPLFSRYYATEIPYGHGQAFPGLIHLSWFTFQSIDQSGFNEVFRAHEMAHQWWGIGVQPADYRDVWLSEGFSDFAGLWYMQRILKDNPKYFHMLKTWADAIRSRHNDAAPLALGTRTAQMNPRDYETIVYGKGAWVLQMLRNMMIDFKTMNEDPFTETMRDFYTQYRGRSASTRDFQRVVEAHMGLPMGWFFDEWVYSSAIPTFVLSWRVDSTPEHPHVLHVRVRQEGVPRSFVMPVPLLIKFSDSAEVYVRVTSRGPLTEGQLALPRDPVRLELNPLQSVLANVKQEDWRTTP
jgi:Peptidase family M1 domain